MSNKIAYVRENHLSTGRITWVVMHTDYCISNANFYDEIDVLPKRVLNFINTHERKVFDDNRFTKSFIYE